MTNEERYTGKGSQKRIAAELMGKTVEFTQHYFRSYAPTGKRFYSVIRHLNPKKGWVVGFTRIQEGKVTCGSTELDYYGGADRYYYFECENTIPCVLVRTWVNSKPKKVPLNAFAVTEKSPELPHKYYFDERTRKELSDWAKIAPRDAKGRFVPYTP